MGGSEASFPLPPGLKEGWGRDEWNWNPGNDRGFWASSGEASNRWIVENAAGGDIEVWVSAWNFTATELGHDTTEGLRVVAPKDVAACVAELARVVAARMAILPQWPPLDKDEQAAEAARRC